MKEKSQKTGNRNKNSGWQHTNDKPSPFPPCTALPRVSPWLMPVPRSSGWPLHGHQSQLLVSAWTSRPLQAGWAPGPLWVQWGTYWTYWCWSLIFPPGSWRTKGQDWGWAQGKCPQQTSLLQNILLGAMQRCCPGAYGHSSAIFGEGWRICCFPLTHLFSLLAGRSQHQNCSVAVRINPVLQQQ